jgi:hypothetical protein
MIFALLNIKCTRMEVFTNTFESPLRIVYKQGSIKTQQTLKVVYNNTCHLKLA